MLGDQEKGQQILTQIYGRQPDSPFKEYYGSFLNKNPKQLLEMLDSASGENVSYPATNK